MSVTATASEMPSTGRELSGPRQGTGQLLAKTLLEPGRALDERLQPEPGGDAHSVEEVDQVLGGHAAGGIRRERVRGPAGPGTLGKA